MNDSENNPEKEASQGNKRLRLLGLEKALASPNGKQVYQQRDAELLELQRRVQMALDQDSLPIDEYDNAKKLLEAIPTARKILKFGFLHA